MSHHPPFSTSRALLLLTLSLSAGCFVAGPSAEAEDGSKKRDKRMEEAAAQLLSERQQADRNRHAGLSKPGAAEFLDLIRVLVELGRDVELENRPARQREFLAQVSHFVLRKRRDDDAGE